MNCKHCNAELEAGVTVCPECGQEVEKPKKSGSGKVVLLVVLAVAIIAVIATMVVRGTSDPTEESVASTELTVEENIATIPAGTGEDDVTHKGSYTVSDEEIVAAGDTVVATMGDAVLTNAELQVYYWMQVYDFLSDYGSYASALGMDLTQPLDTQVSFEGTLTWQQYFLDSAIGCWQNYQALTLAAEEAGFEMEAEYAEYLTQMPELLEESATSYGFTSALDMIQADMGAGATMESYMNYMAKYYTGYLYYSEVLNALNLTDEEVEAYFDENAEAYLAKGLEKNDEAYVDVRHILVMPKGGTIDENGKTVYSDEEWAECLASAESILNEWLAGNATEESFAELANTHSEDPGSNTNGGLYSNVYVGQMVEPFENWCFDASRKYGDYGIVQTSYGYHIMYFVDSEPVWFATAWEDLMTEKGNELMENVLNAQEVNVDYSAIVLGEVSLISES